MTHQNLPDKDQSDSLTIGLGGEERAEQLRFHLFADSLAVVHHFDNGSVEVIPAVVLFTSWAIMRITFS